VQTAAAPGPGFCFAFAPQCEADVWTSGPRVAPLATMEVQHMRPVQRWTLVRPTGYAWMAVLAFVCLGGTSPDADQVSVQPAQPDEAGTVRLELRVFDAGEEVTDESRVKLYPRGQRTNDIPVTATPGQAITATVPVGFYDAQAIREKKGQVVDIRWAEQLLVQRYPDEYGRHLEMINFRPGYGGLQIRPARDAVAAAKGWAAVAHPAGDTTREAGKAVQAGEDLLFALPSGSYDVKVTMADKSTQWIRDMEVPADRTRLKTWSPVSSASR
jgi:hypothetical protein